MNINKTFEFMLKMCIFLQVVGVTAIACGMIAVGSCNGDVTSTIVQTIMEKNETELKDTYARWLPLGLGLNHLGKRTVIVQVEEQRNVSFFIQFEQAQNQFPLFVFLLFFLNVLQICLLTFKFILILQVKERRSKQLWQHCKSFLNLSAALQTHQWTSVLMQVRFEYTY